MKIKCVECESKECFDCPTNMKTEALYLSSSKGAQLFILDGATDTVVCTIKRRNDHVQNNRNLR